MLKVRPKLNHKTEDYHRAAHSIIEDAKKLRDQGLVEPAAALEASGILLHEAVEDRYVMMLLINKLIDDHGSLRVCLLSYFKSWPFGIAGGCAGGAIAEAFRSPPDPMAAVYLAGIGLAMFIYGTMRERAPEEEVSDA